MPNGELSAKQLRWLGDAIAGLDGGCGDITTRANIQLRGMTLAEADKIFEVLPHALTWLCAFVSEDTVNAAVSHPTSYVCCPIAAI